MIKHKLNRIMKTVLKTWRYTHTLNAQHWNYILLSHNTNNNDMTCNTWFDAQLETKQHIFGINNIDFCNYNTMDIGYLSFNIVF